MLSTMNRIVLIFMLAIASESASAQGKYLYDSGWQAYTPSLQFRYVRKHAFYDRKHEYYQYGFQNPSNTPVSFEYKFSYVDVFGNTQTRSGRMTIKGNSKPNQVSNGWSFEGKPGQSIMPEVTIYESGFGGTSGAVRNSSPINSNGTASQLQPHPTYPNVDIAANGKLQPRAGYTWKNPDVGGDYAVTWKPGRRHPEFPNVYASKNQNGWSLAQGYRWKYPGTNRLDTVKKAAGPSIEFTDLKVVGSEFRVAFKHEGINFQPCKMVLYARAKGSKSVLTQKTKWFTPKYDPGNYVDSPVVISIDRSTIAATNVEWWVEIYRHPNWGKGTRIATSWSSSFNNADAYSPQTKERKELQLYRETFRVDKYGRRIYNRPRR